jgi:hypothetical protein
MMQNIKISTLSFMLLLLLGQCKDKYESPYKAPSTGYLVVEGYIAKGPTTFTLSRVISLPGDSSIPAETGAQVQVEGNDNSIYPLPERSAGVYFADTLPLNPTAQYRLRIQTKDKQAYLSDYTVFKITPLIDSINWAQDGDGVHIYANTHDPSNTTRYYQWLFGETWQYEAAEFSSLKYQPAGIGYPRDTVINRADSEYVYDCWTSHASTSLLLGSSVKLAQDVIYRYPLQIIPPNTEQISIRYSIQVSQYALTEPAFDYLTLMKSNTESLGSIFDAQPSVLKGNLHCLNNPTQQVIGYISAGTVQQQRIFISRSQVKDWQYVYTCSIPDTLVLTSEVADFYKSGQWTPLFNKFFMGQLVGWPTNYSSCVDCTVHGGVNKRPPFWPSN